MDNNTGYQKFMDALYAFIKVCYKVILSTLYMLILNAPLVVGLIYIPITDNILMTLLLILLCFNLVPSYVILIRYFREDLNIIQTIKDVYKANGKHLLLMSGTLIAAIAIIYVDIYFFKNIGFAIGEYIFSGILIALIVFTLNTAQVLSIYQASIKDLLLVSVAYTKELTLSAITAIMLTFVLVMLSVYVVPILSVLVVGLCVSVHTWFSAKATQIMRERITKETINEY